MGYSDIKRESNQDGGDRVDMAEMGGGGYRVSALGCRKGPCRLNSSTRGQNQKTPPPLQRAVEVRDWAQSQHGNGPFTPIIRGCTHAINKISTHLHV
ncbi:hypothetical protein V6N13_002825 [Hibiscus sabdariffa]